MPPHHALCPTGLPYNHGPCQYTLPTAMPCHTHDASPCHHTITLPCHYVPLPRHHACPAMHVVCDPTQTSSVPAQLDAIALSPALDRGRGCSRTSGLSSPSKQSCAHSSSHSHSHSPPRHCQRHYASLDRSSKDANTQGKKNCNTSRKGKSRNANTSFFQGGTAACGASACAVCLRHHEHEYAKCAASKLWNGGKVCVQRNEQGRLVFLDGLPVCFSFQTLAGCSDPSHPSRHICSGCGKSGHGTQQCAQAQKN